MLKGKSKIQLFDAKTGEKVLEQNDTNLVTNALETLMNGKDKLGLLTWWRNLSSSGVSQNVAAANAFAMMPLATSALGGILLWDNNITEDPSITVPPRDVYEVGHAGGEYAGTDPYRGSYNANESGEISGGWRHVWDFDTDKANGTIKCLSLTSQHGGNVGWHGCFEGDTYPLFNHNYFYSGNYYTSIAPANNSVSFDGDTTGRCIYMKRLGSGALKMLRRSATELWYVTTSTDITRVSLNMTKPILKDRQDLPVTLFNDYSTVYVYQGKIHEIALITNTKLQHRTFDLDTGEQLSSKEISLPSTYSSTSTRIPAVYRDGRYYCFISNSKEIAIVNEQGEETSRSTINGLNSCRYVYGATIDEFSGNILLIVRDSSTSTDDVVIIRPDDEAFALSKPGNGPVTHNATSVIQFIKLDDMNSPFLFLFSSDHSAYVVPMVNTGYLATINNLQTPINKTSAQTMKITYEIYDE